MTALALNQAIACRKQWSASFQRSFLTLAIPAIVALAAAIVVVADRRIDQAGKWVQEAHAHGVPVLADYGIGVDLRMSDKWFTFELACDRASPGDVVLMRALNGEQEKSYEFHLWERAVSVPGNHCYYAQQRDGGPVSRLDVSLRRDRQILWHREATLAAKP